MWKTSKEVIRGETETYKEINNIDFEILDSKNNCDTANKFNMYYVKSIDNIVSSIIDSH